MSVPDLNPAAATHAKPGLPRQFAVLYHHGLPKPARLLTASSREWLEVVALPAASKQVIGVALRQIDALEADLAPIDRS